MSNSPSAPVAQERSVVSKYLSLVKFSHTIFALPFACIGFALAVLYERQTFQWHLLILMLYL